MAALNERWNRFWFPAVPVERVAAFRVLVAGFALLDVAFFSDYVLRYPEVDRIFFDPVHVLGIPARLGIDLVPASTAGYAVVYTVLLVALAAATVGYRTRLALVVAAPLLLYHWALFNSWGKINHGKIPVIIALFALIVSRAGARYSLDARRGGRAAEGEPDPLGGWALRVVGVMLVGAYVLSVVAKLQATGPTWPFESILAPHLLATGDPFAQWLSRQTGLLVVMQLVTVVAEAAAVLAFVRPWPRNLVLGTLAAFHLGSFVLLETEFLGWLVCYAVFFDLEHGVERLRALPRLRRRGGRRHDLNAGRGGRRAALPSR